MHILAHKWYPALCGNIFNHNDKVLSKDNMKLVHIPVTKVSSFLSCEGRGPKNATVILHPLQVWKAMLFKTRCSIKNEHCHHTQQNQPEKSAFAEHSGHYNLLNDKNILAQNFWYRHHFTRDARDRAASHQHKLRGQFYLSIMWKLIYVLLDGKQAEVLWQDRKVLSPGVTLSYLRPHEWGLSLLMFHSELTRTQKRGYICM